MIAKPNHITEELVEQLAIISYEQHRIQNGDLPMPSWTGAGALSRYTMKEQAREALGMVVSVLLEQGWVPPLAGNAPESEDERITAWHEVASHPAFKECYDRERPLVDSMLDRLTELSDTSADTDDTDKKQWGGLPGNPHEEDARRYSVEASEINAWDNEERLVLAHLATAHATLALAYEQRTANLMANNQPMNVDVSGWPKARFERFTAEIITIAKRLGQGKING